MKLKHFFVAMLILLLHISTTDIQACTNYLVTKGASADGSTMIVFQAGGRLAGR
jgi:hypothetical protein